MKTKVKELIDSIEPLISIQLKTADRLNLDTIYMSTARARETLKQLRELQNEVKSLKTDKSFVAMMDQKFAHVL
jgi:hypothetical protein